MAGQCSLCPLVTSLCVVFICLSTESSGYVNTRPVAYHEAELRTRLMKNYVKEARPVVLPSHAVNVSVSFSFVRIEDLIETTDTFAASLIIAQMWYDPRLQWNASDYGGLKYMHLSKSQVWTPDIVLYNVATQGVPEARYEEVLTVTSNGFIFYIPMVTLYATCPMDLSRFPYDVQTCTLVFGSWKYGSNEMAISFESNKTEIDVDLSDDDTSYQIHQHPQWALVGNKAKARIYTKTYPCCVDKFILLSVSCTLERKSQFYRYLTVGPAAVLGLLVPMLFLLPASSKEKTTYGLLLLLCLTILTVSLEKAIPFNHGSLPHIASFYLGTMILTCLSVFLSVFIIKLSSHGRRGKPVPAWVRTLFLGRLGVRRLLCMGDYVPVDNAYTPTPRLDDSPIDASMEFLSAPAPVATSSTTDQHLHEIHRCLRYIMGKVSTKDCYHGVMQEWEELARVFDRFLFIVFFIFYIFMPVSILM